MSRVLLAGMLSIIIATSCFAQSVMSLTQGTRYVVAFPQVMAAPSEKPMPQPMQLIISSRVKTTVRVQTPASINDATRIDKTYSVDANKTLRIPIPIAYMNQESETRKGYGIVVTSIAPISVSTYQAWMGNGEIASHLPVEAWGKSYYSMNMYQDRYGTEGAGYKYRPSQILVIADNDNTVVSYTPTIATEGGKETPSVRKGTTQTVTLEQGETFLIRGSIDTSINKQWSSDLSGTWIRSSKPIAVVSGHVKCSIMRYPDVLPPTGMFAAEAHFVRSNVHDAMLPTNMAGVKFVTVPCMYTPVRASFVGAAGSQIGIDDDRGDLIRVIALEDGTTVKSMRHAGGGLKTEWNLNKGETRTISLDSAAYWESSKPILMGQYGKSYAKVVPTSPHNKTAEEGVLGHPTVESGMPMLMTVPSLDRWTEYGVFHSPEGMDNFFNIVFKASEIDKIKIDGRTLTAAFGGAKRLIAGTDLAYIRTPIGTENHVVESVEAGVRWCAWSYGSLDGLQQGRAYGAPVAIDVSIPCNDSLVVTEQIQCGDVTGIGSVVADVQGCGTVYTVLPLELNNYNLKLDENFVPGDRSVSFSLNVSDKNQTASAKIRVVSRSGRYVERVYSYEPTTIAPLPDHVRFGTVKRSDTSAASLMRELTVSNPYDDRIITIDRIRFKSVSGIFSVDTIGPVKLGPLKSRAFTITADLDKAVSDTIVDSVYFDVGCNTYGAQLSITCEPTSSVISVSNIDWDNSIDPPNARRKSIVIHNTGDGDLRIHDYDRKKLDPSDNNSHFVSVTNIDSLLPIVIRPNDSLTLSIQYMPRGDVDLLHKDTIIFYSNARGGDSTCLLTGVVWSTSGTQDNPHVDNNNVFSVYPNPSSGEFVVTIPPTKANSELEVVDALGKVVWHLIPPTSVTSAPVSNALSINLSFLPSAHYLLRCSLGERVYTEPIYIIR
jgi:hypothetical protein